MRKKLFQFLTGKRLSLLLAPGNKVAGLENNSYRQIFLKDNDDIASNVEYLIELHYGQIGLDKYNKAIEQGESTANIAKKFPVIENFFSIESTDAQEYTTTKEHVAILFGQGSLTEEQHNVINRQLDDQDINGLTSDNTLGTEHLKLIFQPIKPVYTGSVFENGKMRMMYIKSSSSPLLPQLTFNQPLDKLRIAMEKYQKQGTTVRAAYLTATKVGSTNSLIDIYEDMTDEILEKSSVLLDRRNFRIQQDVPVHALFHDSDEVSMGTQLMKLLFGDGVTDTMIDYNDGINETKSKSGKDLLKIYNDTYGELIEY